jgi:hypothetical protein
MGLIPYPPLPLHSFRVADVCLLMALGGLWELFVRSVRIILKRKPLAIRKREMALRQLEADIIRMRAKGASAFVATSKLERQQLAENKALAQLAEDRKARVAQLSKITRKVDMGICFAVFLWWYGIPMLEFSAHRLLDTTSSSPGDVLLSAEDGEKAAAAAFSSMLFPLSFIGLGIRLSRWGLPNPGSSMGALLVYWSAQTTVSQLMDCADAIFE